MFFVFILYKEWKRRKEWKEKENTWDDSLYFAFAFLWRVWYWADIERNKKKKKKKNNEEKNEKNENEEKNVNETTVESLFCVSIQTLLKFNKKKEKEIRNKKRKK